ncbi:MAG: hypothetical protein ACRECT_08930 [Thermoplasmata archaeon]
MTAGSDGSEAAGPRRFCRFGPSPSPGEGRWGVPEDGLCLSSFLVLSPSDRPEQVLVGRINPSAPWNEVGALDPERVQRNAAGWMLPSCHLLYFESPDGAARRVLAEQLGLSGVELDAPAIVSETYPSTRVAERQHWDLEFLYRGQLAPGAPPQHSAWSRLELVDPARTPRREFARRHDEVLENAGFKIGP